MHMSIFFLFSYTSEFILALYILLYCKQPGGDNDYIFAKTMVYGIRIFRRTLFN